MLMRPAALHRLNARWPFWLLLAAWFCAHSPQILTYELVVWVGDARHFSHQQRLTSAVAFVLAGEEPAPVAIVALGEPLCPPFAPAIPADATLQKITLAKPETTEVLPLRREHFAAIPSVWLGYTNERAAPPHEPPRLRS